jgi:hypothetical protein
MERITQAHLDRQLALINKLLPNNKYEFEYAYNGVKLTMNEGKVDCLNTGFTTKRDLYNCMFAYRQGVQHAQL